jgi:peptidoglycan/LPS O-acetylase OafA/YrhL
MKYGGNKRMTLQSKALKPPPQYETLPRPGNPRVLTVEFWRFAFTVIVCLFHLEIYIGQQTIFASGSSAVEFFFVLAGFTMAMSAKRNLAGRTEPVSTREAHGKAVEFVKNKLKAIYPILIVVMILWLVLPSFMQNSSKLQMAMNTEWEWLMLVGAPFGYMDGMAPLIPLWFLTALIVVGYIYTYAIYKNYDFVKFAAPVIGVLFYIYFAMNAEKILDFFLPMGFLNAGMVRAVAEMSFGMSMFWLYEYLSKKKLGIVWRVLLSLLELYAIYRFFALTLFQPLGMDNYRRMVYILIIVLLSFMNVTLLSKVLNRRFLKRVSSISLTMYLCHIPLVTVYFMLIMTLKMKLGMLSGKSAVAKAVWEFLQDTGGRDANFKPIGMTWKDMLIFVVLVIVVSILITLIISAVKKFVVRPLYTRYKEKQTKELQAAESESHGCTEAKEEVNTAP